MFGKKFILFLVFTLLTGLGMTYCMNPALASVDTVFVTKSASSPSGATPIGTYTETLRFDVLATGESITLSAITFAMYADDWQESGWFESGSGNPIASGDAGWRLKDLNSRFAYISGTWALYAADGNDPSSGEDIRYARFLFTNPKVISNGSTANFSLKITTTGAGDNDRFRSVVQAENSAPYGSTLYNLKEFDYSGAGTVSGLPLYGNILVLQE